MSEATPFVPVPGRKLPEHALWEQLNRRSPDLLLEFCRYFLTAKKAPSYRAAQKWLGEYSLKISIKSLGNFFHSPDIHLKYASLEAELVAISMGQELPQDLPAATRKRTEQIMFEMSFRMLGDKERLALIALQQKADGMKGNFALKKEQLTLNRIEVEMKSDAFIGRMLEKAAELLADTKTSQSDRIKLMRQEMFKDVEQFWATEKIELPGAKDQASKPQAPEKSQPPT